MRRAMLKVSAETAQTRALLARLPKKVREALQRKVMRDALKPIREDLRAAWRNTYTRRKGQHLRAIANATLSDARRHAGGLIVGKVGVKYGEGGGRSKQRIWHLLESGYRHYGAGSKRYANASPAIKAQREANRVFMGSAIADAKASFPGKSREDREGVRNWLKPYYAKAKERYAELYAWGRQRRDQKRTLRGKIAGAMAKRIGGRRISETVARRMIGPAVKAVRDGTLAAAREALGVKS